MSIFRGHLCAYTLVAASMLSFTVHAGDYSLLDVQQQGVSGVTGLTAPTAIATSADGRFVYVVSPTDFSLVVFARSAVTGRAQFAQAFREGTAGVTGLKAATSVVATPDNQYVYVTGLVEGSIAVFARNADNTTHRFVIAYKDPDIAVASPSHGVKALNRAFLSALSPDGKQLWVASRNGTGSDADVLVMFQRDVVTGMLTWVETLSAATPGLAELTSIAGIAFSSDGSNVYLTSSTTNSLLAFSRDALSGKLQWLQTVPEVVGSNTFTTPGKLIVSPDDKQILVAGTAADSIAVFSRDASSGMLTPVTAYHNNTGAITGLDGPLSLALNEDGSRLFVAATVSNDIAVFDRSVATGQLTFHGLLTGPVSGNPLLSVIDLSVPPNSDTLYAISPQRNALSAWGATPVDLAVDVTPPSANIVVGTPADVVLDLRNVSSLAATNVRVQININATLTITSATLVGATVQQSAQHAELLLPRIEAGAALQAHVTVMGAQAGIGKLDVQISAAQPDSLATNNAVVRDVLVIAVPNTPPQANPDSAAATPGASVTIDVLKNDSDSEKNLLRVDPISFLATTPSGATLTLNSDNTVSYQAAAGFVGNDSFVYTADDGHGGKSTATVSVLVDTPPLAVDDEFSAEPGTVAELAVLSNDTDPDGQLLALASVEGASAAGSAVIDGDKIRFTVAENFHGVAELKYTVRDPLGLTASAKVQVRVNRAPTPQADSYVAVPGVTTTLKVLANDLDPDGDTVTLQGTDFNAVTFGALISNDDGTLTFTAAADATGSATFNYTIKDTSNATASSTVTITIDTPPLAQDDQASTLANTPVDVLVLFNDQNLDSGDSLQIVSATTDAVSLHGGNVVIITTAEGEQALRYTPATDFTGSDSFSYSIADTSGATSRARVAIDVAASAATASASVGATTATAPGVTDGGGGGGGAIGGLSMLVLATRLIGRKRVRRTGHQRGQ